MDPLTVPVRRADPTEPAVFRLIQHHLDLMRASSPACSVHAMEADALLEAGVTFFAAFDGDDAVAMGALKPISEWHAEIKSMHVLERHRGKGLAAAILRKLLVVAKEGGHERVSLETGSQDVFAPARAFYGRAGFSTCGPFEGYSEDPNSVFMTLKIL